MIQPQPDVSIVIAAFNAAQTIDRAISSALAQQGVSLEVVVSDDCSTDATLAAVRAIADPRIRVVALPENRGPGAARNAAIDAARGCWIAVLDADDTLLPERLARMIAKAEAANAQIAVDNLTVVTVDGQTKAMFDARHLADNQELTLPTFIQSNRLFHSQHNFGYMKPVFKRQFLSERGLRFSESLRIGEDYILLASALAAGGRCVVDPSVGYCYHITEGSISRELRLDHVEAMIAADADFLRRYRLDAPALSAQSRRRRSLIHGHAFLTMIDCLKRRSYGQALVTALHNPAALRHFRMPVAERIRRLRNFSRQPNGSVMQQP
ncbi:glycosyltransferase family 2 protein [Rhizobium sp. AQ_MP]|uniref:glycosyltransferase family 2 protein n=1 Tax=Rhizobium sp. AQ_MP TaxID=2761536 RepID=UPI00163B49C9|nr:glycosyltransferase family 2 protein [Rhizobium sp. AQ_MP]MBC2773148.1 glycosyltransferase family 2 protein [Rhizobium sp. AQ_MP]